MANLDEEDIIEDDSFRTVLSFSPEVQEAIDQVLHDFIVFVRKVGVVLHCFAIVTLLFIVYRRRVKLVDVLRLVVSA